MAKKTYDVLITRDFEVEGGEVKKKYTTVGAAWEIESGGMSVQIEEGISVTGKLAILPRRDRKADE